MQKQIVVYIENFSSQYLCGYRKSFSTNQALKIGKKSLITKFYVNGLTRSISHNLSRPFDCKASSLWFQQWQSQTSL